MSYKTTLVLMHYPVQNRAGVTITSSITNLDVHDISRTCRTYGMESYCLVSPLDIQRAIIQRVLDHWQEEKNKKYHPDRHEALSRVKLYASFQEVKAEIEKKERMRPEVVFTDARVYPNSVSYADYRKELEKPLRTRPVLLVLGTAWGIAPDFYTEADRVLEPIFGPEGEGGYNHLSVRAAAAVILDRLFGK